MGDTEHAIYMLLCSSGNIPERSWEECREPGDMFNAVHEHYGKRFGVIKIGKQPCFLHLGLAADTMLQLLGEYFSAYAPNASRAIN